MRLLSVLTLGIAPLIASAFARMSAVPRTPMPRLVPQYTPGAGEGRAFIDPQIVRTGEPWWRSYRQSEESIAWHKERAVRKRVRRGSKPNASRYAFGNGLAAMLSKRASA